MDLCYSGCSSAKTVTIQDTPGRPTLESTAIRKHENTETTLDIAIAEKNEEVTQMRNKKSLVTKARDMMLIKQKFWRP